MNDLAGSSTPRGGDQGAIHAPAAIALALAGLLLIPVLFGAALLGTTTQNSCGQQPAAQPGITGAAASDIPAAYLHLYMEAGQRYGLPWNLLAAIGRIETDHGRDPGPGVRSGANSAGAAGPMQIGIGGAAGNNWGGTPRHPAGQKTGGVGVDGNGDGWADVYDPADAIPGAARFLLAHGAPANLSGAVFGYNPDSGYVHRVLAQAARYAAAGAATPSRASAGNAPNLAGTGGDPAACPGDVAAFAGITGPAAAKVLAYARAQLGKPYVYGGVGPDSFDCSGLTMMAYRAAHLTIPRLSDAQYWYGRRIAAGAEQPGDLVFFDYRPGHSGPGHVGIVEDPHSGMMIVAPHTGDVIKRESYKTYPGGPAGFTRPTTR